MSKNPTKDEIAKLVYTIDVDNCRETLSKIEIISKGEYVVLSSIDLYIIKELLRRQIKSGEDIIKKLDAQSKKPAKVSSEEESMGEVLDDFLKNE